MKYGTSLSILNKDLMWAKNSPVSLAIPLLRMPQTPSNYISPGRVEN